MSSVIIERASNKTNHTVKCYVQDCCKEIIRSGYIRSPRRKKLIFFCEEHWIQYVNVVLLSVYE